MADAVKPVTSTAYLRPDAGFLKGSEGLMSRIYSEFAGKGVAPVFKDNMESFVHRYDNPIGTSQNLELRRVPVPGQQE